MPLVSVIIPTRNRPHLLPRTLESVLKQSTEDLEVIVVDDGSTDSTGAVAAAVARAFLRTKAPFPRLKLRSCAAPAASNCAQAPFDPALASRSLPAQSRSSSLS